MYKIPAKTLFLGKNLIFVTECHSTNDLALQLTEKPNWIDGTVIITDNQTAGRGQRGNKWLAEPGKNLTFSLLLKPQLAVREQLYLTLFASLGVRDYVTARTGQKVHVKWPNDIFIGGKKLGGILIENQVNGQSIAATIVGIGLNINQQQFDLDSASSLSSVMHKEFDLQHELDLLLFHIEKRYFQLRERRIELLQTDYLSGLFRLNETHFFTSGDQRFEGKIIGIDESGRLKVQIGDEVRAFDTKEIQYVMA